jgi:hypothetical protein
MAFGDLDVMSQDEILKLIAEHAEESLTLEFKGSGALTNSKENKKELAKDVSAMANSAGGVIVYGIAEESHCANELSPIDGSTYTKEWIEHILESRIHRRIDDFKIIPIRIDGKLDQSIYVLVIGESRDAPHMADGKFYKRHNFQVLEMEEYEVRQAYNRVTRTSLLLKDIRVEVDRITRHDRYLSDDGRETVSFNYYLEVYIENTGSTIEQLYKLNLTVPTSVFVTHPDSGELKANYIRSEHQYSSFTIPAKSPIFQKEEILVARFQVHVNRKNVADVGALQVQMKLFYSNGVEEKNMLFADVLSQKDKSWRSYFTI